MNKNDKRFRRLDLQYRFLRELDIGPATVEDITFDLSEQFEPGWRGSAIAALSRAGFIRRIGYRKSVKHGGKLAVMDYDYWPGARKKKEALWKELDEICDGKYLPVSCWPVAERYRP